MCTVIFWKKMEGILWVGLLELHEVYFIFGILESVFTWKHLSN